MNEPRTDESIKHALKDLIESEGWAIVKEMAEARFGDAAQIRDIDAQLKLLKPADTPGQLAVVTQIRAASLAAFTVLDMPVSRLRGLTEAKPPVVDRFEAVRRWRA